MFLLKLFLSLIAIVVATVIAVQNGKAGKDVSNSASQTPTPVVSVQEPEPAPTTDLTFHIDLLQEDVKKAQEDVKKANEELQIAQEELAESEKNLNKYHKALPSGSNTPVDEVIQTAHNALEGCRGKGNDNTAEYYSPIAQKVVNCQRANGAFYNKDGSDNEEAINEYIDRYITKLTEKQNAVNDARAKVEAVKAKVSDAQAKLDEAQAKLDEAQAANEASVTEVNESGEDVGISIPLPSEPSIQEKYDAARQKVIELNDKHTAIWFSEGPMGPTSPEVKAEYEAVGTEKEAAMKEFDAITEQYIAETGITPEPLVLVH